MMATSSTTPTSTFLLLLLSSTFVFPCFLKKGYANEGRKAAEIYNLQPRHHHSQVLQIQTTSLLPPTACKSSTKGNGRGSSLTIVHKHGPCSQLGRVHSTTPTPAEILTRDQSRVDSIHSRLSKNLNRNKLRDSKVTLPAKSGNDIGSGNYIVTVGLGTPKRDLSLMFDTGSDLTWTQCEPCIRPCYSQKEPIFDPTKSSSYSNITCNSALCTELASGIRNSPSCSGSTCVYGIQYGDQSFSAGFFGKERLTLSRSDVFDGFLFGCGENNQGLFQGAAGLLGLGRNKISLISQTAKKYGQVFSYCLPSTSGSAGFLTFGTGGASRATKFTPLVTNPQAASFYFLDLIGLTVSGQKLVVPASSFSTAGTIIDSGTVITRLPPDAYTALRASFRRIVLKYPMTSALSILDTCYDLSGFQTVTIPKIGLLFRGGIEVAVDSSGILYAGSLSQVCLAFAGNSDATSIAILGNVQQQTMEIIYDVAQGRLGFGARGCS